MQPDLSQPPFPLAYVPRDGIDTYLHSVAGWIRSEPIRSLLETVPAYPEDGSTTARLLGVPDAFTTDSASAREIIRALGQIASWRDHGTAWDFRSERERHLVRDSLANGETTDDVYRYATALGLRTAFPPTAQRYDAMIALGGARLAPLLRTRRLVELLTDDVHARDLVLVGASRSLTESEDLDRDVRAYAPDAATEFDLLRAAARLELQLADEPDEDVGNSEGLETYEDWRWQTWTATADRPVVHVVSAPTSRPGRRANTGDSLRFVVRGLQNPGFSRTRRESASASDAGLGAASTSLLCATSAIYQTFQQLAAVHSVGLPLSCRVETLSFPITQNRTQSAGLQTATQYIQEVRSTFQHALNLLDAVEALEA